MKLHGAEIVDTFAEAFPMWGARVVITADTPDWALEAGRSMTGFATLVIGCKCEASIEPTLEALFEDHYSVQFSSYPVSEPWLLEPARTVAAQPQGSQ